MRYPEIGVRGRGGQGLIHRLSTDLSTEKDIVIHRVIHRYSELSTSPGCMILVIHDIYFKLVKYHHSLIMIDNIYSFNIYIHSIDNPGYSLVVHAQG